MVGGLVTNNNIYNILWHKLEGIHEIMCVVEIHIRQCILCGHVASKKERKKVSIKMRIMREWVRDGIDIAFNENVTRDLVVKLMVYWLIYEEIL